jgi:hypothetical protein
LTKSLSHIFEKVGVLLQTDERDRFLAGVPSHRNWQNHGDIIRCSHLHAVDKNLLPLLDKAGENARIGNVFDSRHDTAHTKPLTVMVSFIELLNDSLS